MNLRHVASCGLACAALVLTGCDSGREDPGRVAVRIANVAPSFAELRYIREQPLGVDPDVLTYKAATEHDYNVDTYDFHVSERPLLPGVAPRSWTFTQQLEANTNYTFVLTEAGTEVQPVILEYEAAPANDAQIVGLHAAVNLPALDLYLERPGVGIAGATPRGTFGIREQIPARTLASGEYELFLTEAGNPANVLLSTSTIPLTAGTTTTFIVAADTGVGGANSSVLMLGASSAVLYDRNAAAELRVVNGVVDATPRDFAVGGQFSPPLFSNVAPEQATAYAVVPPNVQAINVTPVGNPGALELDQQFTPNVAERDTILFGGPTGTLTFAAIRDDGRRIANEAKVSFLNAATQFTLVEYVLTLPGGDPTNVAPVATLAAPSATIGYSFFPPGSYDLYTRNYETGAVLSGPTSITLAARGYYDVLAVNGADTATTKVVIFDDVP